MLLRFGGLIGGCWAGIRARIGAWVGHLDAWGGRLLDLISYN
jgi:hypothetical protein